MPGDLDAGDGLEQLVAVLLAEPARSTRRVVQGEDVSDRVVFDVRDEQVIDGLRRGDVHRSRHPSQQRAADVEDRDVGRLGLRHALSHLVLRERGDDKRLDLLRDELRADAVRLAGVALGVLADRLVTLGLQLRLGPLDELVVDGGRGVELDDSHLALPASRRTGRCRPSGRTTRTG